MPRPPSTWALAASSTSNWAASAAIRALARFKPIASTVIFPPGAVACWSAELVALTTSPRQLFRAIRFPVTFPPANVIGSKTSSNLKLPSPRRARFASRKLQDSVIMSATNSSNGGPLRKKSSAPDPAFMRRIILTACHSEPAYAGRRSENSAFSFFVEPQQPTRLQHAIFVLFFALTITAFSSLAQTSPASFPGPEPANVPQDFISKTGDFGNQAETGVVILLERSRHLYLRDSAGTEHLLNPLGFSKERDQTSFTYASNEPDAWVLAFKQHKAEPIWEIFTQIGPYHRLPYSVPGGNLKVVKPTRSLAEIRTEALAARPPEEKGGYRKSDLVELAKLDPTIHLDIRYATANDFLGKAWYKQSHAFLKRIVAGAL